MKIHCLKRFAHSKSNSFDQNFMKLGHIVKYHNVFFKFDNVLCYMTGENPFSGLAQFVFINLHVYLETGLNRSTS